MDSSKPRLEWIREDPSMVLKTKEPTGIYVECISCPEIGESTYSIHVKDWGSFGFHIDRFCTTNQLLATAEWHIENAYCKKPINWDSESYHSYCKAAKPFVDFLNECKANRFIVQEVNFEDFGDGMDLSTTQVTDITKAIAFEDAKRILVQFASGEHDCTCAGEAEAGCNQHLGKARFYRIIEASYKVKMPLNS